MLGNILYIHFSRDHITVRNVTKGTEVTDEPLIANANNKIMAIGKAAQNAGTQLQREGITVEVVNPFGDSRVAVRDMEMARMLVQHTVRRSITGFNMIAPVVFIQYLGELSTPISPIETRALNELAMAAGARKAFVLVENRRFSDVELQTPNMLKIIK